MSKVICGTVVSTSTDAPALAGLPALSDTVTVTAALPSAMPAISAAGTSSVQLPFACTGGVLIAVEGHGDRLACFGSRRPAQGQILRRLCRIQHVVAADGVDGDRWRGGSDAECLRGRGRIAVHVGYADLYAGVAVLQAAQIGSRYGAGPVAVGIDRRGPVLPAKIMVTVWPASTFEEEPDSTRSRPFLPRSARCRPSRC